jgi:hypothetical protein
MLPILNYSKGIFKDSDFLSTFILLTRIMDKIAPEYCFLFVLYLEVYIATEY